MVKWLACTLGGERSTIDNCRKRGFNIILDKMRKI